MLRVSRKGMKKLPAAVLIDGPAFGYRYYYKWLYTRHATCMQPEAFAATCSKSLIKTALGFRDKASKIDCDGKVVVCFDQGDGGRRALFPNYKIARASKIRGPEVKIFFNAIRSEAEKHYGLVLPLSHQSSTNAEADDMIWTLATFCKSKNVPCTIMSHDFDLLPLIDEKHHCRYYDAKTKDFLSAMDVRDRIGVDPTQVLEYKILTGDKSDGVPGVKLIGKKIAADLFKEHKNLENILEAAKTMRGKRGAVLRESAPVIELSRKLVTPVECPELVPTFLNFLESSWIEETGTHEIIS